MMGFTSAAGAKCRCTKGYIGGSEFDINRRSRQDRIKAGFDGNGKAPLNDMG